MAISPLAGKPAPKEMLVDLTRLEREYYERRAAATGITPSHSPPEDGGGKHTPTNAGPADTDVTQWVEPRANELWRKGNAGVKRVPFATAIKADTTHQEDFVLPYVQDLRS